MGIWSEPLFTVCYNKDNKIIPNDDVKLNFENTHIRLDHNVTVSGTTTFQESIMSICDCAKIFGYLDDDELNGWNIYFNLLFEQNPNIVHAQAHFFCSDFEFPYVIHKNTTSPVKIEKGVSRHALYTKVNLQCDLEEECPFAFDVEMYKNILFNYPKIFWSEMEIV